MGFQERLNLAGVAFDIPYLQASVVGDCDPEKQKQFNLQTGMLMSALEHITPEQMFAEEDPNAPQPNAMSAVKALQIASESGQSIYQITAINQSQTLPSIHHDPATMSEIRAALNAGKEVTTHTDAVSVPGWSGAGYLILDPQTGLGAYKISGGSNGGVLKKIGDAMEKVIAWISAFEKYLGKLGIVGKTLKKVVSQLKRFVKNIKVILTLIEECGPFAIGAIPIYLLALWVSIKASVVIGGAIVGVASGLCGICGALALIFVVPIALAGVNEVLEEVAEDLLDASVCRG